MFRNTQGLNLGSRQGGRAVGDVVLPVWAHTPEEFVVMHRNLLESPAVSGAIHAWIDLIFGYKQRGQAAEEAENVFYPLTYSPCSPLSAAAAFSSDEEEDISSEKTRGTADDMGGVDVDAIADPYDRVSVMMQIFHFGQAPRQIFLFPHPKQHGAPPRHVR